MVLSLKLTGQLPDVDVKILTDQQGLTATGIVSMSKDSSGFLWLLTQNSAYRYNGKQSKKFFLKHASTEIWIDRKNRKWLISKTDVMCYKNDVAGFQSVKDPGPGSLFLFEYGDKLLLAHADGIFVFNEISHEFERGKSLLPGHSKPFLSMHASIDSTVYLEKADSIFRFSLDNYQLSGMPFNDLAVMVAISGSKLLVSDYNSRTFIVDFEDRSKKEISAVIQDGKRNAKFLRVFNGMKYKEDEYLLSTNSGLMIYHSKSGQIKDLICFHKGQELENTQSVRTFFKDKTGTIYLSYTDGIIYWNPEEQEVKYLRNYTDGVHSFPDIDIRGFAEDADGLLWIATANGLANLDMQTGKVSSIYAEKGENKLAHPSIRYLIYYKNLLWVGTGGKGLYFYNKQSKTFTRPKFANDSLGIITKQMLNEDFIWKMVKLPNGNVFIAGGVGYYEINSNTFEARKVDFPKRGSSRSLIVDSYGNIWLGSSAGLVVTNNKYEFLFEVQDSLPDLRVASLVEIGRGQVLVSSRGLFEAKIKDGKLLYFRKVSVFPADRFIYCMEKDANENVWIGTDDGMYFYNPILRILKRFDGADNFQNQAFNSNGLYKSKSGMMFAGGITGMNYFYPEITQQKKSIASPVVSAFSFGQNDSILHVGIQPFNLSYFDRNIRIDISVPEYTKPNDIYYRYKLEEDSEEWIDLDNNNSVSLSGLSPGDYKFVPSVSYDGSEWNDGNNGVQFVIGKPWWQQWWFPALLLALCLLVIYRFMKVRADKRIDQEYQRAIDYFANSGNEHSTVNDILWDITRNCISRLGFEECVIYLLDEEKHMLVQKAAYGAKSPRNFEILNPINIPVGQAIVGHVAASGESVLIGDTSKDHRYLVDDDIRFSEIAVPIIHKDKVIGVIDSEHSHKNFFNGKHLQTLKSIAALCSAKISRGIAIEEMKKAEAYLSELNKKMLETKFLNLRLQMNPHFLFNSLSSIQHLIVTEQTNEAYKYLSIFSNFLRSVLQYADKTFISLDTELQIIKMYIHLESLGSDHNFDYEIVVDEKLDTEDILIPPLIIQPFIENAIWHGLLHKEGNKFFSINFENENDKCLVCTITDNGVGRHYAAEVKAKKLTSNIYKSKSTDLTIERLKILSIKTGKEADLIIEDLGNRTIPEGTCVKLIIPFYNSEES